MPTYEYLCQTCHNRFEQRQKMTDEPLQICPECGNHIRRVFFPAGIVFKGSGFYKTDHGGKAPASTNGQTAKSEDGATTAETKPNGTSSETTSASPTENSSSAASTGSSENKVAAATTTTKPS
jgi:putative FmdB family regulatory protein